MSARLFAVTAVVGLLGCGSTTAPSAPHSYRVYPAGVATPSPSPGIPARLLIPALNINSPTLTVGLMPDGSVGTPCDPAKPAAPCDTNATAWYKGSVRPGEPGDAVLDGHVDWYGPPGSDIPAVFAHLDALKPGDLIQVQDDNGITRSFTVTQLLTLPYPQQPPETYSHDGAARLTLITCTGVYVNSRSGFDHRLYVQATMKQ